MPMLAIVQARLSSVRLPGKALKNLCGRPLLGRVLDRLSTARSLDRIVVATSAERADDALSEFCSREGVRCHRGPLDDVAERLRLAATSENADAFVRISGDSPLIDPALVDRAVGYFGQEECDLVSNVVVRTFPKGQSVEVLRTETFARCCASLTDPDHKEHVTKFYYANPGVFRIVSFTSGIDAGNVNLCVDTHEDVERMERMIRSFGNQLAGWRELTNIYRSSAG